MNTLLFVIIPVYNAERYLESAVFSVLNQPYTNIELILVNDGSGDSSGEICDRLSRSDSRITVFHQENGGVSKARNLGLDTALRKSEQLNDDVYITFLDADDFWKRDMKWTVEDCDGADIIAFSSALSNEKGDRFKISDRFDNGVLFGDGSCTQWIGGPFGASLYRADFLRRHKLRFPEKVTQNEDVIFRRQAIFSARKIVFSSEVLYVYRANRMSVTHSNSIDRVVSLHIPNAWNKAINWIYSLPNSTDTQRLRWTEACHKTIGATLLENVRILAEHGYSADELITVIKNSSFEQHLNTLQVEWLADWQKSDLIMLRSSVEDFAKHHQKRGRWKRIGIKISRIPIVRKLLDYHRYDLTVL